MNPFNTIFPIFKCADVRPWKPVQEYGTASYLGEGVYITAAHSLLAPDDGGKLLIGLPLVETSAFTVQCSLRLLSEIERHEELDIGLLRLYEHFQKAHPSVFAPNWYLGPTPFSDMLGDVCAAGFPHGLNTMEDFNAHTSRVYKGNIVSVVPFRVQAGKAPFLSYELSFQVPIGLSGAPVMTARWPSKVIGIAIGMKETAFQMKVTREIEDDGKRLEVYTTAQMQHYGVAVPSTVIGGIHSPLLGTTIGEFIARQGHKVEM